MSLTWFRQNRERLLWVCEKWAEFMVINPEYKKRDNRLAMGEISCVMETAFPNDIIRMNNGGRVRYKNRKTIACKSGKKDIVFISNPMTTIRNGIWQRRPQFDFLFYVNYEKLYVGVCTADYIADNCKTAGNKIMLDTNINDWQLFFERR